MTYRRRYLTKPVDDMPLPEDVNRHIHVRRLLDVIDDCANAYWQFEAARMCFSKRPRNVAADIASFGVKLKDWEPL